MIASLPNTDMFCSMEGMFPGTYSSVRRRRCSVMAVVTVVR